MNTTIRYGAVSSATVTTEVCHPDFGVGVVVGVGGGVWGWGGVGLT